MKTVTLLIGPPASGKSSYVEPLSGDSKVKIVSSDAIRYDLQEKHGGRYVYQPELNTEVFSEVHKQFIAGLEDETVSEVIIDATNINYKDRRYYVDAVKKQKRLGREIDFRAIVFVSYPEELVKRNEERIKNGYPGVKEQAIMGMLKRFRFPNSFYEGFNSIQVLINPDVELHESLIQRVNCMQQDNPYHIGTVNEHINELKDKLDKGTNVSTQATTNFHTFMTNIIDTHDLGKVYTKTLDENGIGHFYGHEGVSSYILPLVMRQGYSYKMHSVIERHMVQLDKIKADKLMLEMDFFTMSRLASFWELDKGKRLDPTSSVGRHLEFEEREMNKTWRHYREKP